MPSVPDPNDVLASVKTEGLRRRRRRHRRRAALAGIAVAAAAVPALALLPESAPVQRLDVAGAGGAESTTSTTAEAPLAVPGDITKTSVVAPPTTPTTAAPAAAPTTVAVDHDPQPVPTTAPPPPPPPVCRNSTSAECGPFTWDPVPTNAPLSAAFVERPTTVTAGTEAVFTVQWSDPDAHLEFDNFSPDGAGLAPPCSSPRRTGPWDPPAPAGGSGTVTYRHTFAAPGTYTVTVSLGTGVLGGDCADPYASGRVLDAVVEVVPVS